MPILVFQHSDIGAPGRLGLTLRDHGFKLDIRRPDLRGAAELPPDLDDVQGLVSMGGPMNVTDIATLPWMQREAELIKAAHARDLPVIGICLGAQLIAHALGGKVGPKDVPDVGLRTMSLSVAGQTETMLAGVPWDSPQLFSCGQEIKELPPGATLLAGSKSTKVCVFKAGLRTYGFINHFECDRPMVESLAASSAGEMSRAGVTAGDIASQIERDYATFARVADRLCVNITTYCFPSERRIR